jgi:hypothetical protein
MTVTRWPLVSALVAVVLFARSLQSHYTEDSK